MTNHYNSVKNIWIKLRGSAIVKWFLRVTAFFIILILVAYMSMAYYINNNKAEVLASLTSTLGENINGNLNIGSMEPVFLQGFPLLSLNLKNVIITDSLYPKHKQVLLRANNFDISVNALALLRGAVEIKRIGINDAEMNIYTDSSGYSNTNVFKKSSKAGKSEGGYPEIKKFSLENVKIRIDNKSKFKLYNFDVHKLTGNLKYDNNGWNAKIDLETRIKSMAFNTKKGSFAKEKEVEGDLDVTFDREKEFLQVHPSDLEIGGEDFEVSADFELGKTSSKFVIDIKNEKIKWRNASNLLAENISEKLEMYNLEDPISVWCHIAGDFNLEGDPLIHVKTQIKNNIVQTPGGTLTNCSFDGEFTNLYEKDKGYNDANSAVIFSNFEGDFADIPLRMKKAAILDLENPIAKGEFTASFDISKLNNLIDRDLVAFTKGKADVSLSYVADIVNYELAKPLVSGTVSIKNADVNYSPRNLKFNDISVKLNFKNDDLFISKIHLRSGKSVLDMQGHIRNFLNLYYSAPETIVLKWDVTSKQLYLSEFMDFLGERKATSNATIKKGNFTQEINTLFDKSNVDINLKVDNLYYDNFHASDVSGDVFLNDDKISIKNGAFKHAGGTMKVDATLFQKSTGSNYELNTTIVNVNVSKFFESFDSFGLESLQPENLKGFVSVKAKINGKVSNSGSIIPKSMTGNVLFSLRKAALLNFAPVKNVGKFAFPFRDLNTIAISSLDGEFNVKGEKVTIEPMKINSSVLNMDMEGVYSFGAGTEIYLSVPLRNPERDKDVTDRKELKKRRTRGIVLNLVAKDGDDGKVKVGLGKRDTED